MKGARALLFKQLRDVPLTGGKLCRDIPRTGLMEDVRALLFKQLRDVPLTGGKLCRDIPRTGSDGGCKGAVQTAQGRSAHWR